MCIRDSYMTVNTLVKEREMKELYSYLLPYYEQGLDAVIVQDMGVFSFVKRHFPDLDVHASTQMTVTGAPGAALIGRMGASRICLLYTSCITWADRMTISFSS